jgi:molybdate transport system regulatory protein
VLLPPHVSIGDDITFGPGKIELLRKLGEGHSISSAARALGMTYKRAWALVDTLNRGFGRPVVETSSGGKGGGGARLTPLGEELVARYSALEAKVSAAGDEELAALAALAAPAAPASPGPPGPPAPPAPTADATD